MNIDFIKDKFENIKDLKITIERVLNNMHIKIECLKNIYNDYIKKNNNTEIVLTLDSFHFQTKFIMIEYENYDKIYKLFLNRLYGDYYKFYKYIMNNILHELTVINSNKSFPIYKDLKYITYDFETIIDIHNEIMRIVHELTTYLITLQHENKGYEQQSASGLNINNFVSVNKFKNLVLAERINLITDCLTSYSSFQSKFLERFLLKLKFSYAQISADIKIENNEIIEKSIDRNVLDYIDDTNQVEITKIFNNNTTPSVSSDGDEKITVNKVNQVNNLNPLRFNMKKLLWITLFLNLLYSISTPPLSESTALIIV